jgi:hypothetical protein
MGDEPVAPSKPTDQVNEAENVSSSASPEDQRRQVHSAPFRSQYPTVHPSGSPQQYMLHGGSSPFNVASMASSLPDYGASHSPGYAQPHAVNRSPQGASYPIPPGMSYPPGTYPMQPGYGVYGQTGQFGSFSPNIPGQPMPNQPVQMGYPYPGQIPAPNSQYPQSPAQYYYPPGTYGGAPPPATYQPGPSTYPVALRSGAPVIVSDSMGDRSSASFGAFEQGTIQETPSWTNSVGRRTSESSAKAAIPRGPPRKPKQSGHALWVGNLPPGATITDLKDHFSRDFTGDIESLFLISKSNCAFVNYRTEEACTRAMQRFHDSRFQGVRLVCRPRKPSSSGVSGSLSRPKSPPKTTADDTESDEEEKEETPRQESTDRVAERFFIVKSLTLQDLEQSVRNGIWATQSHNEFALNKAFHVSDLFSHFLLTFLELR